MPRVSCRISLLLPHFPAWSRRPAGCCWLSVVCVRPRLQLALVDIKLSCTLCPSCWRTGGAACSLVESKNQSTFPLFSFQHPFMQGGRNREALRTWRSDLSCSYSLPRSIGGARASCPSAAHVAEAKGGTEQSQV